MLLLAGILLILAIALFAYAEYRPRRSRMDTTSIDMRRVDDGLGGGNPGLGEDQSRIWR